jgi:hypothetical protein
MGCDYYIITNITCQLRYGGCLTFEYDRVKKWFICPNVDSDESGGEDYDAKLEEEIKKVVKGNKTLYEHGEWKIGSHSAQHSYTQFLLDHNIDMNDVVLLSKNKSVEERF